jgi:hypothetical protein
MANVDRPNGARVVPFGRTIPTVRRQLKIGVSVVPGDWLIMLSNGTVDIALSTSAALYGVAQTPVVGSAALEDIDLVPALKDLVFEMQCSGTYSPVNAGEVCDIEGATGVMEANENAQSTGVLQIVGLANEIDNAAGANARILVTVAKSQWNA